MKKVTRIIRDQRQVDGMHKFLTEHFLVNCFAVEIVIQRFRKPRSLNQNATMHMWFTEFAEFTGNDAKSVKSDLKAMFLPEIEGMRGIVRTKDTHELNVKEMEDFMNQIQVEAADMGIQLTQPVMNR